MQQPLSTVIVLLIYPLNVHDFESWTLSLDKNIYIGLTKHNFNQGIYNNNEEYLYSTINLDQIYSEAL